MTGPRRASHDWREVARIIVEARCFGMSGHAALQEILGVDAGTATYLMREARISGWLGFDLHRPTRAVIHRGTEREKFWMVCGHCTDRWPCAPAETYVARMPDQGGKGIRAYDHRTTPP